MSENKIKVNASTSSKAIRVNVSAPTSQGAVSFSQDTSAYNAGLAEQWAISENLVLGQDYSSKYYANQAKESANNAEGFANISRNTYDSIVETVASAVSDVQDVRNEAVEALETNKQEIISIIESEKEDALTNIQTTSNNAISSLNKEIEEGKQEIKESVGDIKVLTTLEIGDIGIAPLGIDETKGKRRYLNGQLIIQDQYVQFTNKVKSAVALYPSLACTESEWQTTATMTVGGQVGKFVVDDEAGTIRLPKIIMPIQGLTDLSKLGEIVEAGLPNITGETWNLASASDNQTGALSNKIQSGGTYKYAKLETSGTAALRFLTMDASLSNPIYSNSDTVQQEQIQYPYFIQVATGAETEDNITNTIELNNPFFYGMSQYFESEPNNISWLKSAGQYNAKAVHTDYYDWALINANNGVEGFKFVTDEYTDYDVVINPADETFRLPLLDGSESLQGDRVENLTLLSNGSTYTAPANGWYNVSKKITSNGTGISIDNLTTKQSVLSSASANGNSVVCLMFVKKGDIVQVGYDAAGATVFFRFIYATGNGSLYYYVGETVQNANLINAGRIEEKITNALAKPHIVETYVNGASWYRVYSDGWCEQGGSLMAKVSTNISVTLLKEYANINYQVQLTYNQTGTGATSGTQSAVNLKTTTSFAIGSQGGQTAWFAYGYIN